MKLEFKKPKGMHDSYGDEANFRLYLYDLIYRFSVKHNFEYFETPIVEDERVFTQSLGATSDVVEKEMFYLKSSSKDEKYVLRPENTAGIIRAYFENGLFAKPQPLSIFYLGKMFRKENPQRGRLREFTQWGLEIINTESPFADFYIIFVNYKFLKKELGLSNVSVALSSLGCEKCRPKYRAKLISYYQRYRTKLCHDCQRRLKENPLRLLDCKNVICQPYKKSAPPIFDYLCKSCKSHFQGLIEILDKSEVSYFLDKNLVRGFDYYEKTVFEIFSGEEKLALGGGGRYDLGKIWVKQNLPSVGSALGIERVMLALENEGKKLFYAHPPRILVAYVGEELKYKAFTILEELRENNLPVTFAFFKHQLSAQLEYANKIGVKYVVIVAFEELSKNSVILKDLEEGVQEVIPLSRLKEEINNRLSG